MRHAVRNHEIEVPVREVRVLRILLREMYPAPQRLGPRMAVAQDRRGDVDGVYFRIGEGHRGGPRAAADGAAHIEYPEHPQVGKFLLNVANDVPAWPLQEERIGGLGDLIAAGAE